MTTIAETNGTHATALDAARDELKAALTARKLAEQHATAKGAALADKRNAYLDAKAAAESADGDLEDAEDKVTKARRKVRRLEQEIETTKGGK